MTFLNAKFARASAALLAVATLTACGGGGGAGSPAVPQAPAAVAGPNPANSSSTSIQGFVDNGSRTAIPGLALEPASTATLDAQSVKVGSASLLDTFDTNSSTGLTAEQGTWALCNYPGSSEEYCGTSQGDQAIATAPVPSSNNYRLQSWVRLQNDTGNASLIAREQDLSHFYELELRTLNGVKSWFIWKNQGGTWIALAGGNYQFVANTYYRLRLDVNGSSVSAAISADGTTFQTLGTVTDVAYPTGKAALRTFGSATTSFDVVSIAPLTSTSDVPVPGSTPTTAPASGGSAVVQNFQFSLSVPTAITGASAASYISPSSRSLSFAVAGGMPTVVPVSSTAKGCSAAAAAINCTVSTQSSARVTDTVTLKTFASADGSGMPLSIDTVPASSLAAATPLIWSPVVASLKSSFSGSFSAGVPSSIGYTVSAYDGAGNVIPFGSAPLVDSTGAPINVSLADSDASGKTTLGATQYVGNTVMLSYNGDLPLPNPVTVTATPTGSVTAIGITSAVMTQPTASKNFTVSFGGATVVPNNTGIALSNPDIWNQTPDAKLAVVNLGNGKYFISFGEEKGVITNTPYPELAQGANYQLYNLSNPSNFEQGGVWFRDVLPLGNPYHPADPNQLVAFYHAESDWTGVHTKTVAVSYSHDGGKSWSKGAQILTPYQYTTGQGVSAGDSGATYDPVNKRWVEFFTAIDNSSNTAGNLSEAISADPLGAPGTWFKLINGGFTQPGIGGQENSLTAVRNSGYVSSPCVSWNSYLNEWVMIADLGGNGEGLMTSPDLYTWSAPIKIMDGTNLGYTGATSAYPTLVGPNDDKITGQTSHLYFGEFSNSDPRIYGRLLMEQNLTFHRND